MANQRKLWPDTAAPYNIWLDINQLLPCDLTLIELNKKELFATMQRENTKHCVTLIKTTTTCSNVLYFGDMTINDYTVTSWVPEHASSVFPMQPTGCCIINGIAHHKECKRSVQIVKQNESWIMRDACTFEKIAQHEYRFSNHYRIEIYYPGGNLRKIIEHGYGPRTGITITTFYPSGNFKKVVIEADDTIVVGTTSRYNDFQNNERLIELMHTDLGFQSLRIHNMNRLNYLKSYYQVNQEGIKHGELIDMMLNMILVRTYDNGMLKSTRTVKLTETILYDTTIVNSL